eukprot:scaffold17971_cov69-Skeletonema_menzelii.AAC.1
MILHEFPISSGQSRAPIPCLLIPCCLFLSQQSPVAWVAPGSWKLFCGVGVPPLSTTNTHNEDAASNKVQALAAHPILNILQPCQTTGKLALPL